MSNAGPDQLRLIPLFTDLPSETLAAIASLATPFTVRAGHVLVERGQAGSGIFLIEAGRVEVDLDGGRKIELGPGAFFGELSLLTDRHRTARVHAVTEVEGLAIGRRDFEELVETQPRLASAMLKVLAARLAEAQEHVV
ncbi:MAG: cyclic nucleotide-binding domain-containing protein [Acidimicrobiia bacterium]